MRPFSRVAICVLALASLIFLWIVFRQSALNLPQLQFARVSGDSNFPKSVKVFVGLPTGSNEDNVFLLVTSEPMMFGASFKMYVEQNAIDVRVNDHEIAGTATIYNVHLPGIRAARRRDANSLVALRDAVSVGDFFGLLK